MAWAAGAVPPPWWGTRCSWPPPTTSARRRPCSASTAGPASGSGRAAEARGRQDGAFRWHGGGRCGLITLSPLSRAEDLVMRHAVRMLCLAALLYGGPGLRADDDGPPAGFASLFNGKDLSGWKVPEGDGGHWKVIDGVIDYDAG